MRMLLATLAAASAGFHEDDDRLKDLTVIDLPSGRPELLGALKLAGLTLPERQRLATVIAKSRRAGLAHESSCPAQRETCADLEPQGFTIWCHNTTLANGHQLNNDVWLVSQSGPELRHRAVGRRVYRPARRLASPHEPPEAPSPFDASALEAWLGQAATPNALIQLMWTQEPSSTVATARKLSAAESVHPTWMQRSWSCTSALGA